MEVKAVRDQYIKDNLDRKVAELKRDKNNRGPLINLRKPKEVNLLQFEPTKAGLKARNNQLSGLFNTPSVPAISSIQANSIRASGPLSNKNLMGGKRTRSHKKSKRATRKVRI